MATATLSAPPQTTYALHRFSVDEYHQMVELGFFNDQRVELLDGYVIKKMTRNPPHDGTIQLLGVALTPRCSTGWCLRFQSAITLSLSEPEPDLCVARGSERTYLTRHPGPGDVGLVIEVSDSTLATDRYKCEIYARDNIPTYWIVNLVDRQIEVYTAPSGPTATPDYAQQQNYTPGMSVPFALDGILLGQVAVDDLLP